MVSLCLYFQVHQPFRLHKYRIFDIGQHSSYFNEELNKEVFLKVARNCYIPANDILLKLIEQSNKNIKIAFSLSGTALEQMEKFAPFVLESFKELAKTGCVEFLSETYYHSLSFLYSRTEFKEQIELHRKAIQKHFGQTPLVFRNTELVYSNDVAHFLEQEGFKAVFAEGWEPILGKKSPNFLYRPIDAKAIKLFLKNYKLSDDIAFRFGDKHWEQYPLTPQKYVSWLDRSKNDDIVNLFMDYETFGEHQLEESGIFKFLREMPLEALQKGHSFVTPSEALEKFEVKAELDVPFLMSWADSSRDLSAWLGNKMQQESAREIFELEGEIKRSGDEQLLKDWRALTSSDHFYYMCTKQTEDGVFHNYFCPYGTPYDSYVFFMNALNDLIVRLKRKQDERVKEHSPLYEEEQLQR
ncbi:polysaccharide deacetylase family protein [Candidatus Woesearchaeota archaeon]|nr:glycoside hydrolase family 57 protein [Nanoarchaeota archaeon]MCB9370210.1 polysaccharide deacetylase family protein [Candidatus Woesearchaeota archaeon]USN44738.1 MAG: polysaccharide deacetylase family protein [Candidatus Woesearchaeota archaeon]